MCICPVDKLGCLGAARWLTEGAHPHPLGIREIPVGGRGNCPGKNNASLQVLYPKVVFGPSSPRTFSGAVTDGHRLLTMTGEMAGGMTAFGATASHPQLLQVSRNDTSTLSHPSSR